MLDLNWLRPRASRDDEGAVLVSVVVVMIVGFIIASVIAASVMFTIRANATNGDRLDAFIAAESGRDVAVAAVANSCTVTAPLTGTGPDFTATVYTTTGAQPADSDAAGLTANACPTATTTFVVINSIGTGADGATAEIDAIYPWTVTYEDQPGGTVAFFDGTFTTTKSGYKGDLVVRDPDALYWCNNSGTIDGDLYVVDGNAKFSGGCEVTGSVYVNGTVEIDSSGTSIGGDIIASGNVSLASDGNSIGGNVHSGGIASLTGTGSTDGTVGTTGDATTGDVIAVGDVDVDPKWKITGTEQPGSAAPVFSPTMPTVYGMTTWLDMTTQNWDAVTKVNGSCGKNYNPVGLFNDATTSLQIDFTGCGTGDVDLKLGAGSVTRDVVLTVPAGGKMLVNITGNLTAPSGESPQIAFVHADADLSPVDGEKEPTCGNNPQKDSFDVASGLTLAPRIMIYTPCGLTGNVKASFSGQFYTANDGNHTISADFTCVPMSWPPSFEQLGCKIKSSGGAGGGGAVQTLRLGELVYQTER
ncbi:hypothetical protein [Microbacterium sp. 2FI]|uniref:hypothetical protein n=1 Tax=Microbacterium sp. 2FI TaxID=2502193 RepID=UPI0010F98216|nr:hypothetical protein [Microbacterium sp. 2FI]